MGASSLPVWCVVLAGGGGKRLFPLSTSKKPKYFLEINGKTLLERTVERARRITDKVLVVCNRVQTRAVRRKVGRDVKVLGEPRMKNTAPAICLSALRITGWEKGDAVLVVMPSDHLIEGEEFFDAVGRAVDSAREGYIATFGVKPTYPATGYGYIEVGEEVKEGVFKVSSFKEKPDLETAKRYLSSGRYFWNSGIFVFRVSVILQELEKYTEIPRIMREQKVERAYELVPDISIDYAVMEKTDRAVCVPASFFWSDIGSYASLKEVFPSDEDGNTSAGGRVYFEDAKNCFARWEGRENLILFGVEDIVVVRANGFVLVTRLSESQKVRKVAEKFEERGKG